ncbi:MAG TPA: hypothetical protein VHS59_02490, partial [Bacillota bacterium]|nr:hypothetical protein [Bacillota bacterium]
MLRYRISRLLPGSHWQIAATYIGTVVGAGFASGQETLQFFAAYGMGGILGIIVASLGFGILGAYILYLGKKLQTSSYQPLFHYLCGKSLGRVLDVIVTIFLFGAMVVMLAGVGAIFEEHLGIPRLWGVVGTMLLALVTVFYGLKGVMAANTVLIPIMILLTVGISLYSLNYHGVTLRDIQAGSPRVAAAPHWLLSAFLYISYNL